VLFHIHGASFHHFYRKKKLLRPYISFILGKADVVICLSEMWREYFSSTFRLKRLEVLNNVIEAAPPAQNDIPRNGHVNLLFLGVIGDRKGIFDLLRVIESDREHINSRVTVTVAGNGEVERLQKTISENHRDGVVKYAGWVNGSKKSELLNMCDVYILPSYNEGLPISILEAMAYGKPVIATDVGGIPEIVKPGYNGWLFKAGDLQALRSIIHEVLDNKNILKEYGNNSLRLSKNYMPEAVINSLEVLYKKIINE
jgi:glycosyltransferase involved in cell wall biosynthesis